MLRKFLIVFAFIAAACLVFVMLSTWFFPSLLARLIVPRDAAGMLSYMTPETTTLALSRFYLIDMVVERGSNPQFLNELQREAQEDNPRGDYACFALFRLRDNPHERLNTLLERLNEPERQSWAIRLCLTWKLDVLRDAEFSHDLTEAAKGGSEKNTVTLVHALSAFVLEPETLDAFRSLLDTGSPEVKIAVLTALGEAAERAPKAKQDPRLLSLLTTVLSDPSNALELRDSACTSLAQHGWSRQTETTILSFYRTGGPAEKIGAIHAMPFLHRPGRAIFLLIPFVLDKYVFVRWEAFLNISFLLIVNYWWLLAVVIAADSLIRRTGRSRKRNTGITASAGR